MTFQQALSDLADIRRRLEAAQTFRGYRAFVALCSSGMAVAAAILQPPFLRTRDDSAAAFVIWWSVVAAASVGLTALDLAPSWFHDQTGRERSRIRAAAQALLPCLATGAGLAGVIIRFAPHIAWVLPGVWSLLFAQGVFASAPFLPRGVWIVGAHYTLAGLIALATAAGAQSLAPWTMVATFGAGQLLAAFVLYTSEEKSHAAGE